jgi:hypothetical protein
MNNFERHHIIPKHEWFQRFGTLDGVDAPDNMVFLPWNNIVRHTGGYGNIFKVNGIMLLGRVGQECSHFQKL